MKALLERLRAYDHDRSIHVQHEDQARTCAWNAARSVLRARYAKAVAGVASGGD